MIRKKLSPLRLSRVGYLVLFSDLELFLSVNLLLRRQTFCSLIMKVVLQNTDTASQWLGYTYICQLLYELCIDTLEFRNKKTLDTH